MLRTLTQCVSFAQGVLTQNVASGKKIGFIQLLSMDYEALMRKRLREARIALGKRPDGKPWAAQDVADKVPGIGRAALSNYENGARYPGPNVFVALSKLYNEPPTYLAGLVADGEEATIARAYFHADAKGRAHILSAAEMALSIDAEKQGQTVERAEFFETTPEPEKKPPRKKAKPKSAGKRGR
jgi:transcriptional regulator with XRE-family HTH domain